MYQEFIHPKNGAYYVFIEVPSALLDLPVLETANCALDKTGNIRSISNYVIHKVLSLNGTKALILLAADETGAGQRMLPTTEEEITEWDLYLLPKSLGYKTGKWLTIEQYKEKLKSVDYYAAL